GGVNYAYAFPATCRPSQTDASSITDLVSPFANVPSEKHRIAGRSIHPPTGKRAQQATIMGKSLQIAGIATRRQERGSSSGRAAASSADSLTAHVGDVQYVRISPPSASASAGTSPGHPSGTRQGAPTRRQRVVDVARWCAPMDELLSEFAPGEGGDRQPRPTYAATWSATPAAWRGHTSAAWACRCCGVSLPSDLPPGRPRWPCPPAPRAGV